MTPFTKVNVVNDFKPNLLSQMLTEQKIIYCPDYVINAGGLINVYDEMRRIEPNISLARVRAIADTLKEVFRISEKYNTTTLSASRRLAEQRLLKGRCERTLVKK